jgi:hypothetical protein
MLLIVLVVLVLLLVGGGYPYYARPRLVRPVLFDVLALVLVIALVLALFGLVRVG